jgi:superfamily II DNA or RNA helicase
VLIASIVETWLKSGDNQPTIAFCVNRLHAKKVQGEFIEAGVHADYIDAFTDRDERRAIRKRLESGETKVCASVGCLIKGIDWAIGCIIMARPTKSDELLVQMLGRGLRVNDGIGDLIILDHTDNLIRLGLPHDIEIKHGAMCRKVKGEKSEVKEKPAALPKKCPKCAFLKPPKVHKCLQCAFEPVAKSDIVEADGELKVIGKKSKVTPVEDWRKRIFYAELLGYCASKGKTDKFALANYRERFKEWPPRSYTQAIEPSEETLKWLRAKQIAFAKRKAA